ncbi:YheC/YheD family protein [Paenibacillus pasadenensis]|uniref:ATP-grasp domain-containing protein n=1 Tax=Paenibacillus pasadenensis TaxID=217090 RepID=A0A2N5NA09_9BACL|nr:MULTISPECIES: YheC/YheD family protein [Paenibacillus]PLT47155.1 hypothetical protein B8V81_1379 [Paenibacillus pasadenensis]QGG57479.1 YheC/YheD family protein [Paenibacillus sp. B01]
MSSGEGGDATRRSVASKMEKTQRLLQHPQLAKSVPATRWLNEESLAELLRKHRMVYVKPDVGRMGIGVMRVERTGSGWAYQSGEKVRRFATRSGLYRSLAKRIGDTPYLVQRGIRMLEHEGRPFDFRLMIQQDRSGAWACNGTAARVAHPAKIVSNGSQGGTIFEPMRLLAPAFGQTEAEALLRRMDRIALQTAGELGRSYPALRELGLDLAVDTSGKPWILEVNTRPDPCPFTKLDDPAIIRRIVEYGKGYGRHYKLICNKAKKAP